MKPKLMKLFSKKKELKRLDIDQLAVVVEKVIEAYSPEVLAQFKSIHVDNNQRKLILTGTPYWTCAQLLDKYIVGRSLVPLEDNSKEGKIKFNLGMCEVILNERQYTDSAISQIRKNIGENINEGKYSNSVESFVYDCISAIQIYEAFNNPSDPDPDTAQVMSNISQNTNVIRYYREIRNSETVEAFFAE